LTHRYNDAHDAWYDDEKDEWITEGCDSPGCEYCEGRPHRPSYAEPNKEEDRE